MNGTLLLVHLAVYPHGFTFLIQISKGIRWFPLYPWETCSKTPPPLPETTDSTES